jgi:hypothetical protein
MTMRVWHIDITFLKGLFRKIGKDEVGGQMLLSTLSLSKAAILFPYPYRLDFD